MYHLIVKRDDRFSRITANDRRREHVEVAEGMGFDSLRYALWFGETRLFGLAYKVVAETDAVLN